MSAKYSLLLLLFLLGVVSCHTSYVSIIEVVPAEAAVTAHGLTPAEVERAMALFASFAHDEGFRLEEREWEQRGDTVRVLHATKDYSPSLHVDLVEDAFAIQVFLYTFSGGQPDPFKALVEHIRRFYADEFGSERVVVRLMSQ